MRNISGLQAKITFFKKTDITLSERYIYSIENGKHAFSTRKGYLSKLDSISFQRGKHIFSNSDKMSSICDKMTHCFGWYGYCDL